METSIDAFLIRIYLRTGIERNRREVKINERGSLLLIKKRRGSFFLLFSSAFERKYLQDIWILVEVIYVTDKISDII